MKRKKKLTVEKIKALDEAYLRSREEHAEPSASVRTRVKLPKDCCLDSHSYHFSDEMRRRSSEGWKDD